MPIELTKEQKAEAIRSLQWYFTERLDQELNGMQADFLLRYFFQELAPIAYNQGVEDARRYFASKAEDLSGACFEEPFAFRSRASSRGVRRKPD